MAKRKVTLDPELAAEAKSIVAIAFRNGPIEDVHAGKECPTCAGKAEYSHITQAEIEHYEAGGGHGLQVALAEAQRPRKVCDHD